MAPMMDTMVRQESGVSRFGPDSPEAAAALALGTYLGISLEPRRLTTADGTTLEVEGMAADGSVVAQFVLNDGALRSPLRNKVAADLFKLVWVSQAVVPGARAVLCVSASVAPILGGRGWLSSAARDLGVAVLLALPGGRIEPLAPLDALDALGDTAP
jgi:hypothetical protein